MLLSQEELHTAKKEYEHDGWHELPSRFGADAVRKLQNSVDTISRQTRPEVVYEKDTDIVRGIHGCHEFDETCARLVRLPAMVGLAETLLGGPAYVYQFKVNLKQPKEGAAWPWHQDFAFWSREDGMPTDNAVNVAVFLDDTHEANGPLQYVPGSHRFGLIGSDDRSSAPTGDWRQHVAADLAHTVPAEDADRLVERFGTRSGIGPAGTVVAFSPSIMHASSNNRSPDRRALLLVTYNAVDNAPADPSRPPFLVGRDTTPVTALTTTDL